MWCTCCWLKNVDWWTVPDVWPTAGHVWWTSPSCCRTPQRVYGRQNRSNVLLKKLQCNNNVNINKNLILQKNVIFCKPVSVGFFCGVLRRRKKKQTALHNVVAGGDDSGRWQCWQLECWGVIYNRHISTMCGYLVRPTGR